jgi:hypothetical protein
LLGLYVRLKDTKYRYLVWHPVTQRWILFEDHEPTTRYHTYSTIRKRNRTWLSKTHPSIITSTRYGIITRDKVEQSQLTVIAFSISQYDWDSAVPLDWDDHTRCITVANCLPSRRSVVATGTMSSNQFVLLVVLPPEVL